MLNRQPSQTEYHQRVIRAAIRRARQPQQLLEPTAPFSVVAADVPEAPERHSETPSVVSATLMDRPVQRGSQIVVLGLEAFQPTRLIGSAQVTYRLFGQGQAPVTMACARYALGLGVLQ